MTSVLETLDWIVLSIYFLALIAVAVWVVLQKNKNTEDYFLAGRSLPWWAIGASLIAANISLNQWRQRRAIVKSEKKANLEQQLESERRKLKKVRDKTRDYRKMVTKIGDFRDMSPDEIKVKLDQIYDWNDKNN